MPLTEGATKVASTAVEAMRSVPLAIALLLVNVGFLAFAAYVLGQVAVNASERHKTQTELTGVLIKEIAACNARASGRPQSLVFRRPQ